MENEVQIDIQSQGISLTGDVREHTERRLGFALARAALRVRRIRVHVADVNGPRGGIDKRCRIQATVNGLGEVVVEDTHQNLLQAISTAADRLRRKVMRRLARATAHARATLRRTSAGSAPDEQLEVDAKQ